LVAAGAKRVTWQGIIDRENSAVAYLLQWKSVLDGSYSPAAAFIFWAVPAFSWFALLIGEV